MRTLKRYYQINYMDECIAKKVIPVYAMDKCFVLCCNNTTILFTYFKSQLTML